MITASLDIGSEKMVMALAERGQETCRLLSIKYQPSQGMERGVVKDWEKVRSRVQSLLEECLKEGYIDFLNVALSGKAVQVLEKKVTLAIQKKVVEEVDLSHAMERCRESFEGGRDEVVGLLPVSFAVDKGEAIANPLGQSGRFLEAVYQVYTANTTYVSQLRNILEVDGIGEVVFYPVIRAYIEGLEVANQKDFALVDLGQTGIQMAVFRDGLLEYDAYLPLGMRAVDKDIMAAFGIKVDQAKALREAEGQAYRALCKNKKVQIPDTRLSLDSRDLAMVIQCRAEELLEGVVYLLQKWRFTPSDGEIWLAGGGAYLQHIDILLQHLSGHVVKKAVVSGMQAAKPEVLQMPEYAVALGLLLCESDSLAATSNESPVTKIIRSFFGI